MRSYRVIDPSGSESMVRAISVADAMIQIARVKTGGIGSRLESWKPAVLKLQQAGWKAQRVTAAKVK